MLVQSLLWLFGSKESASLGCPPSPLRIPQREVQIHGCSGAVERVLGADMIVVSAQPTACRKLCAGSFQAP